MYSCSRKCNPAVMAGLILSSCSGQIVSASQGPEDIRMYLDSVIVITQSSSCKLDVKLD